MTNKHISTNKQFISITEMARNLNLSRARFYQLLNEGFFPKPLIDDRTKRPYYTLELQQQCLECRQSGVGIDGSILMFYSPRNIKNMSSPKKKKQVDPVIKELGEILNSMGLETAFNEIQKALDKLYPDGTEGMDQGIITRELYRYFKE